MSQTLAMSRSSGKIMSTSIFVTIHLKSCPHEKLGFDTNGTRLPGQAQSQTSPPVLFPKGSGS